jgi:hypothetical protein
MKTMVTVEKVLRRMHCRLTKRSRSVVDGAAAFS